MLTPPVDLSENDLAAALGRGWGIAVASIAYRAVGFGSHHWVVVDARGASWFVTVDELAVKRLSLTEPEDTAFRRLSAALRCARDLRDAGRAFVVAPVLTADGEPTLRLRGQYGIALSPYVEGESFAWDDFAVPTHRRRALDLIIELHMTPTAVCRHALVDDFAIPHRDELALSLQPHSEVCESGPYAARTSTLLVENAARMRRVLARYDDLVTRASELATPMVLTHGEPHPGNTMLTAEGWVLVDWDTVLVAPPERDLWSLDPGDGSIIGTYAAATGVRPRPAFLDLFRVRWDLADIAVYVSRFRGEHSGSSDDQKSWHDLCAVIARLRA